MDRIGYAFASGYQAALRALVPDLGSIAALAATEEGGAHPRAIAATLTDQGRLSGRKVWCTLAPVAEELLVVARREEEQQGRPVLVVARIAADQQGVRRQAMGEAPFAPEIPHAILELERVEVPPERVLPGDGYERYLRPFRTIEDIHVFAAITAHAARVSLELRSAPEVLEPLLGSLAALVGLSAESPADPGAHLALAAVLDAGRAALEAVGPVIDRAGPQVAERWRRDVALLGVAQRAREARRAKARERLSLAVGVGAEPHRVGTR
jgi:hypothetical protein